MGSSKKQTVGYWYRMGLHMGLCHEADAVLELRAGDRSFWSGEVSENNRQWIEARNLFGGESREGGVAGYVDFMMGRPDQAPNEYLTQMQGLPQPGHRGFTGLVLNGPSGNVLTGSDGPISSRSKSGIVAANNPYLKAWAVRVRSILRGWHEDRPWFPATASVPIGLGDTSLELSPESDGWHYKVVPNGGTEDFSGDDVDTDGWSVGASPFASESGHPYAADVGFPPTQGTEWPIDSTIWVRRSFNMAQPQTFTMEVFVDNFATVWINGIEVLPRTGTLETPSGPVFHHEFVIQGNILRRGLNTIALKAEDFGFYSYAAFRVTGTQRRAMNPAHMIVQALTDPDWGMGYPIESIDDESFRIAAGRLFAEGFGLCLKWNNQTTIQEFTQIVADHASLVYGQDRRTGLFRMRLLRKDYNEADLPVFTKRDVVVERYQRPSLADTTNEVVMQFDDIATGKESATAPLQNLANIQGQGRVVSQSLNFPGLPTLSLAARAGMRELGARSVPLWRLTLKGKRRLAELLPGDPFVLDLLDTELGIRLVVRAGDIDYGTVSDGEVRAQVVEDVFAMPDTTYVGNPGPGGEEPDLSPRVGPSQVFEVPYTELVQTISAADLQALPLDAGYVGAVALRPPGVPLNYELHTRLNDDVPYEAAGSGDYAPGGVLATTLDRGPSATVLQLASASRLSELVIGSAAFLGAGRDAETVRIDAVDLDELKVTVGRGVADTVPRVWPAGTRLWGFDVEATADPQQYVAGESIDTRVVNLTNSGAVPIEGAPQATITMDSRAARPYPPGWLVLNGSAQHPAALTGPATIEWAHRDRVLQADTLVDTLEPSVGPEPGTTYTVRWLLNGTVVQLDEGLEDTTATFEGGGVGVLRAEVESVRDNLVSWQVQFVEVLLGNPLQAEDGSPLTFDDQMPIFLE